MVEILTYSDFAFEIEASVKDENISNAGGDSFTLETALDCDSRSALTLAMVRRWQLRSRKVLLCKSALFVIKTEG